MTRALRWAVQLGLTALVTYFLLRALRLSWADLRALEWEAWIPAPVPLALSVVILLATFLYLVALWARLLERLDAGHLPFGRAVQVFFLSLVARYVPGKVWQIAGLAYLASQEGLAPGPAAFTAVLSQVFSLAAAVALGALYVWTGPAGSWIGAVALAAGVFLGALAILSRPGPYRWAARLLAGKGAVALQSVPVGPRFTLTWLGLHTLAWVGYAAAFCLLWASFRPLSLETAWLAAAAFPAAYALGYAAFFAPAGIGVREGALAALTAPVLGTVDATALAVVTRVWMTGVELLPLVWVGLSAARGRPAGEGAAG